MTQLRSSPTVPKYTRVDVEIPADQIVTLIPASGWNLVNGELTRALVSLGRQPWKGAGGFGTKSSLIRIECKKHAADLETRYNMILETHTARDAEGRPEKMFEVVKKDGKPVPKKEHAEQRAALVKELAAARAREKASPAVDAQEVDPLVAEFATLNHVTAESVVEQLAALDEEIAKDPMMRELKDQRRITEKETFLASVHALLAETVTVRVMKFTLEELDLVDCEGELKEPLWPFIQLDDESWEKAA